MALKQPGLLHLLTFKHTQNTKPKQLSSRNEAVKAAYFAMLKVATQLLSTIEREELRYSLVREDAPIKPAHIIHEFVNPLIYLRLESFVDSSYGIRFGFEPCQDYAHITLAFTRSVYRLTAKEMTTTLNIENSIHLQWFIHNPDELYAYIEKQNKYHTFKQIKYKQSAVKRKQMHAVA